MKPRSTVEKSKGRKREKTKYQRETDRVSSNRQAARKTLAPSCRLGAWLLGSSPNTAKSLRGQINIVQRTTTAMHFANLFPVEKEGGTRPPSATIQKHSCWSSDDDEDDDEDNQWRKVLSTTTDDQPTTTSPSLPAIQWELPPHNSLALFSFFSLSFPLSFSATRLS